MDVVNSAKANGTSPLVELATKRIPSADARTGEDAGCGGKAGVSASSERVLDYQASLGARGPSAAAVTLSLDWTSRLPLLQVRMTNLVTGRPRAAAVGPQASRGRPENSWKRRKTGAPLVGLPLSTRLQLLGRRETTPFSQKQRDERVFLGQSNAR